MLKQQSITLGCSSCEIVSSHSFSMDPAQPADTENSTITVKAQSSNGYTSENYDRSAMPQLFMTGSNMEDEDRLVAIRSTVSALRKEEEEVNKRLQEKAVVKKLQDKVELYMSDLQKAENTVAALQTERDVAIKKHQDDEAAFQQRLRDADEEIQAVTAKHDKLAAELTFKDSALTDCQARNTQLMQELVSYRAQSHEMSGTIAAYTELHQAQASRADSLYIQVSSLEQRSMSQESTIQALHRELDYYRSERAKSLRVPPHNMHGPVGGPRGNYPQQFYQSHAPAFSTGYDNGPVPICAPMQGYGALPLPTEQPQLADAMEQVFWLKSAHTGIQYEHAGLKECLSFTIAMITAQNGDSRYMAHVVAMQQLPTQQPEFADAMQQDEFASPQERGSSSNRSDAAQSGDSFYTAHASDDRSQALAESEDVVEGEPELSREFSFSHSVQEPLVELGQAFLIKLQNKDVGDTTAEGQGTIVAAVHPDLTSSSSAPNPPVQASRSGKAGDGTIPAEPAATPDEEAATEVAAPEATDAVDGDASAALTEAESVQEVSSPTVTVDAPAAEAPEAPLPPPPRRVVYVTPLPPGYLASMSDDEQQSYKDSLDRVSLCHPTNRPAPTLAGVYVTPMPPGLHASSGSSSHSSMSQGAAAEQAGANEVKQQRTNRSSGAHGSAGGHATGQQIGSTSGSQQTGASGRDSESAEATAPQPLSKHAKKKAKKNKRKKAAQNTANDGQ